VNRGKDFITSRIPHREPFLWLDSVVEISEAGILAEKYFSTDLPLFAGHYPDYPLVPGVILCEAVFQAGALLVGELFGDAEQTGGVPVLTRILGAKFKREVRPGDTVAIRAAVKEVVGSAWFLKGQVRVAGKLAVQVEFACMLKG